ncbi:MAG TPA: 4-vinyl reductase [Anaerolineae bacterium]|nr:4-vinyl reductase [Anaerolineae bacterium]
MAHGNTTTNEESSEFVPFLYWLLCVWSGASRQLSQSVGEDLRLRVEDRGDTFAYIAEDCPMCAGKQADMHICWIFNGTLQEGTRWLTGKEFEIEEVACRAMGTPACVWEVSKKPKE